MRPNGFVQRLRLAAMLQFWRKQAQAAATLPSGVVRDLRGQAKALRRELDQFTKTSDQGLAVRVAAQRPTGPRGSDLAWRPNLWQGRLDRAHALGTDGSLRFDGETALYHDCPLGEISARQISDPDPAAQTPVALVLEVYGFAGSYLSISVRLPDSLTTTTNPRHIVALEGTTTGEVPIDLLARLNIAQGPDVAQIAQPFAQSGGAGRRRAEFDLGHAHLSEKRIEKLWIDIFFQSPALNRIVVHDLVVSRRPRAEL